MTFTPEQRSKTVVDKVYRIKSDARERSFQRPRIANFLYTLEFDSRRVKVTSLKLSPSNKRLKPGEIGDDLWTFEAALTVRSKTAEASKPGETQG